MVTPNSITDLARVWHETEPCDGVKASGLAVNFGELCSAVLEHRDALNVVAATPQVGWLHLWTVEHVR